MFVVILILFPLLLLFNPRLAMAALIVAIVVRYIERSRSAKRSRPKYPSDSGYKPGYED
jgi:hypothetical protein